MHRGEKQPPLINLRKKKKEAVIVRSLPEQIEATRTLLNLEMPRQLPTLERERAEALQRLHTLRSAPDHAINDLRNIQDQIAALEQKMDDIRSGKLQRDFEAYVINLRSNGLGMLPAASRKRPRDDDADGDVSMKHEEGDGTQSAAKKARSNNSLFTGGKDTAGSFADLVRQYKTQKHAIVSNQSHSEDAEMKDVGRLSLLGGLSNGDADHALVGEDEDTSREFDLLVDPSSLAAAAAANQQFSHAIDLFSTEAVAPEVDPLILSRELSRRCARSSNKYKQVQLKCDSTPQYIIQPQAIKLEPHHPLIKCAPFSFGPQQQSNSLPVVHTPLYTSDTIGNASWSSLPLALQDNVRLRPVNEFSERLVDLELVTAQKTEQDLCPIHGKPMVHSEDESIMSCQTCGFSRPYLDTTTSSSEPTFNHRTRTPAAQNERMNVFEGVLSQFDPAPYVYIPESLYCELRAEWQKTLGSRSGPMQIGNLQIRDMLKKIGQGPTYYHNSVQIFTHLNGRPSPFMAPQMKCKYRAMFTKTCEGFEKVKEEEGRANFPNYLFVFGEISKLLAMSDPIYLQFVSFVDSIKGGPNCMALWKKILHVNKWDRAGRILLPPVVTMTTSTSTLANANNAKTNTNLGATLSMSQQQPPALTAAR